MRFAAFLLIMGVVLVATTILTRRFLASRRMRMRLDELSNADLKEVDDLMQINPWPRYRWLAGLFALLCGGILVFVGIALSYVAAFTFLTLVLAIQIEATWAEWRERLVERLLSEVLDMMIASVKAGASLTTALETARSAIGRPLQRELNLVVDRIRLGDSPQDALLELSVRLPLETVRLFCQALAVNWSIGGKLSDTLANVGRTVRDRAELTRRTQAMSTQARLSVSVIIAVTYFIAALMWRNDPPRFEDFLTSLFGRIAVCLAIVAQGIGVFWVARLSRPKF